MKRLLWPLLCALPGCATYVDPNYAIQIDAYRSTVKAQQTVELERARAEAARYQAIAALAATSDNGTRGMALMALALGGHNVGTTQAVSVTIPQAPERVEDRALKWAALFAGPIATLTQGYFTYRLGVTQSNNSTNASIASYNALGNVASAGFGSNQSIAGSGFLAAQNIAGAGFRAIGDLQQPPAPNYILNGTGVIGSGSYVGPNSGANSGNNGRISSPDNNQRNCPPVDTLNPLTPAPC